MCIKPRRQRGVTLVELIMFMVIVSVALVGVLQVMRLTTGASADPLRRKQALLIAESLLEEVQLAKFSYCDPASDDADSAGNAAACAIPEQFGQAGTEPPAVRPFDNVNDYVTAAGVPQAAFDNADGVLVDANGAPMGAAGYTARLTVSPQPLGGIGAAGATADTEVLHISVAVSYDDQTLVLDGYRARYAPNAP